MKKTILSSCFAILIMTPFPSSAFDFRTDSLFRIQGAWDSTDPVEKQFVFHKKSVPIPEAPAGRALVLFFKAPFWMYSPAMSAPRRICNRIYTGANEKVGAVIEGSYFFGTAPPGTYGFRVTGDQRTVRGGGKRDKRWLTGRFTFEAGKTYVIECTYFGPPLRLVNPANFLYHFENMNHIKEVLPTPPADIPPSKW